MEMEEYCPVCGDLTTTGNDNSGNETNITLFSKSPEFRAAFETFNKLFGVTNPPWFEKRFIFCQECKEQLSLVYELEEVLEDTDKSLVKRVKLIQDKFRRSEFKFRSTGVYQRDKRYWEFRTEFMSKESTAESQAEHTAEEYYDDEGLSAASSSDEDDDVAVAHHHVPKRKKTQNETTSSLDASAKGQQSKSEQGIQPKLASSELRAKNYEQELSIRPKVDQNEQKKQQSLEQWRSLGYPEVSYYGVSLFKKPENNWEYHCSACTAIVPLSNTNPVGHGPLKRHIIKNHTNLHKCKECGERFGCKTARVAHFNKVHRSILIPNSLCDLCGKLYKTKTNLKTHKEKMHNILFEKEKDRVLEVDKNNISYRGISLTRVDEHKNLFKCSKCVKVVERKEVWRHVKTTHLDPPFLQKCSHCEKTFNNKYRVAKHEKICHKLWNKTFCPICSKPFYGQNPLRSHVWTHYSKEDRQEALARGAKIPVQLKKRSQREKCPPKF